MNSIPKNIASELCWEIRLEQITRWYSWFYSPCWNCTVFSNGNPAKMRVADQLGYTGCASVNARYQKRCLLQKASPPKPALS